MTALTPQQMRELADVLAGYHSWKDVRNGSAALRAAADQLDAVQDHERISSAIGEVLFNVSNYPPAVSFHMLGHDIGPLRQRVTDAVLAILTADTAPQEPRMSATDAV